MQGHISWVRFYRRDKFGVSRKVNGIDSADRSTDTSATSATDSQSVPIFRDTSYNSYNIIEIITVFSFVRDFNSRKENFSRGEFSFNSSRVAYYALNFWTLHRDAHLC